MRPQLHRMATSADCGLHATFSPMHAESYGAIADTRSSRDGAAPATAPMLVSSLDGQQPLYGQCSVEVGTNARPETLQWSPPIDVHE